MPPTDNSTQASTDDRALLASLSIRAGSSSDSHHHHQQQQLSFHPCSYSYSSSDSLNLRAIVALHAQAALQQSGQGKRTCRRASISRKNPHVRIACPSYSKTRSRSTRRVKNFPICEPVSCFASHTASSSKLRAEDPNKRMLERPNIPCLVSTG